jgi:hypothetical protein
VIGDSVPAGLRVWLVGVCCGLAAFLLSSVNLVTLGLAGIGLVAVAAAYVIESRTLASIGGLVLLLAVVLAAVAGLGVVLVVAAAVATLLSWTFTHSALDLRASLGAAPSRSLEFVHVAGTTTLAIGAGVLAIGASWIDVGAVSPVALALVLLGGLALAAALRSG